MKNKNKIIIFTISLLLFITLVILISVNKISRFDSFIYNNIIKMKSAKMTGFMKIITNCASVKVIIILCIASLISLFYKYKGSIFLLINVMISSALNVIVKNIICRERPSGIRLITETGYSFPSGHAMASISFYCFLIFLVLNSKLSKGYKIMISIILSILILLIGVSRIYLGVHYASDVIGGYLLSICLLMVSSYILKKKWSNEI